MKLRIHLVALPLVFGTNCIDPRITVTTCETAPSTPAISGVVHGTTSPPDAGADLDVGNVEVDETDAGSCVTCAEAKKGLAFFEAGSLGRVYQTPCPGSLGLWQAYYDELCATGRSCHDACADSLCMTGFPSGNCLVCVEQHATLSTIYGCTQDDG